MKKWKIKALLYGTIEIPKGLMEGGLDPDIILKFPYTGYLLQNGEENVLVDTGIHADHIVDGKAWRACPAEGGADYVLKSLEEYGLSPADIDTVIYTHLHNDHAGTHCCSPMQEQFIRRTSMKTCSTRFRSRRRVETMTPALPGTSRGLKTNASLTVM